MIVAELDGATIAWADGRVELLGASEPVERRIRAAFSKPARVRRSSIEGGTIEELLVRVAPGTAEHARAALLKLRASILLDSD